MTDLTIRGETFRVSVEGDPTRPPLMLSNSLGTTLSMWDGQMSVLTRHFRVIRYDARGHGGSIADDRPSSIARLGGDALAILDALEIEKVHWVGLSMGGAVGLWLLIHAPHRIGRGVLANTAAHLGTAETWNARIASVLADGMARNAAATIERWFTSGYAARAPDRVKAIHAMLRATSPQGYATTCAALRDMDLRSALGAIDREVLVVTGRSDPVIPKADADALIGGISGARHVVLDARHMSNIEAEADFNAAIIAFLNRPVTKGDKAAAGAKSDRAAKKAPTKTKSVKRSGGAGRRSNPARNPLKTASVGGTPTRRPPVKKTARKTAAAAKTSAPHRRPAAKRTGVRPGTKASPKRQPRKVAPASAAVRRPTPAVRGSIKKAKPVKGGTAKTAAKKPSAKATTKTLPAARRKPTKKPRRPAGRRPS